MDSSSIYHSALARNRCISVVGRLPVCRDFLLCTGERHLTSTNQALQLSLDPGLALGAARSVPAFQFKILELARVSAKSERDDVMKFVLERFRVVVAGARQKSLFYSIGEGNGWSYRLGVAGHADCLSNGLLRHVGVERAAVACGRGRDERQPKYHSDFWALVRPGDPYRDPGRSAD